MVKRIYIILTIIVFIPIFYFFFLLSPTSFTAKEERFVIPLETNQQEIVERLINENFIRSKGLFNILAALIKFPGTIEPGAYMISRKMTIFKIANILLHHPYQKWVVLRPGLRIEEQAETFVKVFKWTDNEVKEYLDNAREGYMFPDTYLLNVDYTPEDFVNRLISNFNEKFDASLQADLLAQDVRNDTAIKIASLIERESGGDTDKALISGIIWNRLNKSMKLQIDATTQYILGKPGNWWPKVSPTDHKTESPFNTYLVNGLPPGPIANPSLASIKAAVYPAETDCFYYIHDRNKEIHCSKKYEEHLENIERYLK